MNQEKINAPEPGDVSSPETAPSKSPENQESELQTSQENVCREKFVQEWVMASELTPAQKIFVVEYVQSHGGAWREYNGTDFKVVEAKVEGGFWKISFGVFLDGYEAQRIDVQIPLSE